MFRLGSTRLASAVSGMLVAGVAVVGCSDPARPAPSPTASSAVPSAGGDPAAWSPLEFSLDMGGATFEMVVGQAGVFRKLGGGDWLVQSSNPDVVGAFQGASNGTEEVDPGVVAQGPGLAQIVVYDGAKPVVQFTIRVLSVE